MAPHNFWLKRQLPLPGISIQFPPPGPEPTLRESQTESSTTPATSISSTSSQEIETPVPSSSSSAPTRPTSPARPTPSAIDEIEETQEEQLPSASSSPSASEGILVRPAPTPEPQTPEPLVESTTTVVAQRTVTGDVGPSSSGVPARVGAAKGNAFLDNKVLSGVVFAICGLVGLFLIVLIIWLATRKARQTKKLEGEIISWDPDHVRGFGNSNATQPGQNAETRSIDELEEKGRSLDAHFNTYTLPSQTMHAQSKQATSGGYSDYYPAQRPIQVSLPPGEAQPYRANW